MFGRIIRKVNLLAKDNEKSEQKKDTSGEFINGNSRVRKGLDANLNILKDTFGKSNDVVFREFVVYFKKETRIFVLYINGLMDDELTNRYINSLLSLNKESERNNKKLGDKDLFTAIKYSILDSNNVSQEQDLNEIVVSVLSGNLALFIEGYNKALHVNIFGGARRNIEEPKTEPTIRGPHEGFTETLQINSGMRYTTTLQDNIFSVQLGLKYEF